MNIKELHLDKKAVSTASLFKLSEGTVTSIQIMAKEQLKEHITKVPALLICLSGDAVFENENGAKLTLKCGDFVNIGPNTKHWINSNAISNFILIK